MKFGDKKEKLPIPESRVIKPVVVLTTEKYRYIKIGGSFVFQEKRSNVLGESFYEEVNRDYYYTTMDLLNHISKSFV